MTRTLLPLVAVLALGVIGAGYRIWRRGLAWSPSRQDRQQDALNALGAVRGHRTPWTDDDRKIWRQR